MDIIELGEAIREKRIEKKLSQTQLAERAGVSRVRLNALEKGRAGNIGFISVMQILSELNLDLRMTTYNRGRPTLDDLQEENKNAPRMG